ncbi:MAG: hypothetical protein WBA57_20520 [Elainellaceae cyanobacterium]
MLTRRGGIHRRSTLTALLPIAHHLFVGVAAINVKPFGTNQVTSDVTLHAGLAIAPICKTADDFGQT